MEQYAPKLVCFSCNFEWGYLSNHDSLTSRIENWVPVVCSGKIDTCHILDAFKKGADGVLILGCREGHCHFQDGNYQTGKKVYLVRKILQAYGVEPERVRMVLARDPDGATIPNQIREMKGTLQRLGPLKALKAQ